MYPLYEDITKRIAEKPLWWDQNGVPRYEPFNPKMCDIYADYGALSLIRCQGCGQDFAVGVAWSIVTMSASAHNKTDQPCEDGSLISMGVRWDKDGKNGKPISFPSKQDLGEFGYGDAPWHTMNGRRCAGTTMTTEDVACLEFWKRVDDHEVENFMEWIRLPE